MTAMSGVNNDNEVFFASMLVVQKGDEQPEANTDI